MSITFTPDESGGGSSTLDGLTDTTLSSPSNGQVLTYNGTKWVNDAVAGTGDVVGPASATDNALARFNSTTGKLLQNSTVTVDDSGNISISGNITVAGTVDGRDVAADGTKLDGIESSADVTDEANVVSSLDGATLTGVTVATGDKVLIQDADDADALKTVTTQAIADLSTTLTQEEVEDYVGAMVTGNTETGITVTYQDGDGTLDFVTDITETSTSTLTNKTLDTASNTITVVEADISDLGSYLTDITGEALSTLSDVTITGIASGELMKWNGSAWVNNTLAEAGVATASHTHVESDITDLGTYLTASSTTTLTNKTFDANGTGNSLSNVDVADLADGTDGELITWDSSGNPATVAVGTSGHVLTSNGTGAAPTFQASAGGGGGGDMSVKEFHFPAEAFSMLETNSAAIEKVVGSNVSVFVQAFDDTTEEYVNGKIQVPTDVDTSETVTFRAYVMAKTAAASKNIELRFGHLALNNSEDFDPASPYTNEDSGDEAIDATQDDVTEVTWTETVSNLGWAANDMVLFRLSRIAPSADNLSGDMYLFNFTVEIPRA